MPEREYRGRGKVREGEREKKTKLKTSNKFYTNANKAEPSDSDS